MKISLYIRACIKIIPWKFRILNPTNARGVIYLWSSHFFFLKSRPLFNAFCCFYMFANKHFVYIKCACFKKWKVLQWEICNILFFIWRRIHCKIFISALVYINEKSRECISEEYERCCAYYHSLDPSPLFKRREGK